MGCFHPFSIGRLHFQRVHNWEYVEMIPNYVWFNIFQTFLKKFWNDATCLENLERRPYYLIPIQAKLFGSGAKVVLLASRMALLGRNGVFQQQVESLGGKSATPKFQKGATETKNRKQVVRIVLERHMDTTWYNYDKEKKHLRLGISRYHILRYLSKYNGSWLLLVGCCEPKTP